MKKIFAIGLLAAIAGFAACQNHNQAKTAVASTSLHVTDTAKAYQQYLNLKDNLVKTDGKAAQESAKQLVEPLSKINGCSDAAQMAGQIAATADVKKQRAVFMTLSQDMIPLVKGIKSNKAPVYVQYCPMAGGGKGGYWLSAQKEVKNPYYGDDMLECGEVKEEIK
ncbi:DUF3347 domain-containing protein [Mucilaginibacter sp. Bleaf8]|uniref:DUF3347 domain-containing protein n=1 Tax=Mucilaginibacter sp. Bleaf8 TaxID=2834430 RepID=UPI001BCB586A|nr:DUF3347 domain-containing protein [Mucilaginibacter sp. Bleaf8]MBS7563494.1 DUF3347 domain-containing protein [Mucilaginibacter sp. Bleaf8]